MPDPMVTEAGLGEPVSRTPAADAGAPPSTRMDDASSVGRVTVAHALGGMATSSVNSVSAGQIYREILSHRTFPDGLLEGTGERMDVLRDRYSRVMIDDKGMQFNTDLLEAIELGNLLDTAQIVVTCALNRTESRGGHYASPSVAVAIIGSSFVGKLRGDQLDEEGDAVAWPAHRSLPFGATGRAVCAAPPHLFAWRDHTRSPPGRVSRGSVSSTRIRRRSTNRCSG